MRDIARWMIIAFHFLGGMALLTGLLMNFDPVALQTWGGLSFIFLALPLLMIAIAVGLWLQVSWVRWLVIPLVVIFPAFSQSQ